MAMNMSQIPLPHISVVSIASSENKANSTPFCWIENLTVPGKPWLVKERSFVSVEKARDQTMPED